MKRRLVILGSTGSIGTRALEVAADFSDRIEVVALTTNRNVGLLEEQIHRFHPKAVCVTHEEARGVGEKAACDGGARFYRGASGLVEIIDQTEADIVLVATVGFVGLLPTLHAIDLGRTIALANKEVLVTAGDLVMGRAKQKGVDILPVDSEHNAVFQCLGGCHCNGNVKSLILTASGGPFRGRTRQQMTEIAPEDALRHPTWNMGRKITIDCATLMNKGFEVIEATHLFGMPVDKVRVVIHPQSTVHSMVEYSDGSIIAQMGTTDMYLPIQNVLLYPERLENRFPSLNLAEIGTMAFEAPDRENFPCLNYAYESARKGGTYPAVLNAANEIAVERFLDSCMGFLDIGNAIGEALNAHDSNPADSLDAIVEADRWARKFVVSR